MANYEEKLLKAIDEDIRSNAQMVVDLVNKETENLREDQLSFYKEGLKRETETYLDTELHDLRTYAATKSSQIKLDTKKKLLELRSSLVNELFDGLKKDLIEFTKSDEYITYLSKKLDEIDVKNGYFMVRENDVEKMSKLLKDKNLNNDVKVGYFAIGGFVYVDEENKKEYSCLLDEKRKEAEDYFRNHCEFRIDEEGK